MCQLLQLSHCRRNSPPNLGRLARKLGSSRWSIAAVFLAVVEQSLGARFLGLATLSGADDVAELGRPVVYCDGHLGGWRLVSFGGGFKRVVREEEAESLLLFDLYAMRVGYSCNVVKPWSDGRGIDCRALNT